MTNTHKKIAALKQAALDKRQNAILKVQTTLRIMREKHLPISFQSVAKLAGVSKYWLYKQTELSEEIYLARTKEGKIKRIVDLKSIADTKDKEIKTLKEKNLKLKLKVKQLKNQLETVYGELYKLKREERL